MLCYIIYFILRPYPVLFSRLSPDSELTIVLDNTGVAEKLNYVATSKASALFTLLSDP